MAGVLARMLGRTAAGGGGGSDPYFSDVVLLVSGIGANGSTSFTDESSFAHTLTANGNVQVDTSDTPFSSGGAILFDGTGDFISAADSADWLFGSNAFTVEGWVNHASTSGDQAYVGQWETFDPSWVARKGLSSMGGSIYDGSSVKNATVSFTPTTSTWYYWSLQRVKGSPNDTLVHHRGTAGGSASSVATTTIPTANSLFNSSKQLRIGANDDAGSFHYMNGRLYEIRVTHNQSRYGTGSFTVPTAAFPRS